MRTVFYILIYHALYFDSTTALGWTYTDKFSRPGSSGGLCSPLQIKGFNWDGLELGSFSTFGDIFFSGWSRNEPQWEPGDRVIVAELDLEPSIICQEAQTMTIEYYDLSSSTEQDIEFYYEMLDGSTCVEYHHSSSTRTRIYNRQCGNVGSVTLRLAGNSTAQCEVAIYKIGFDCADAKDSASMVPASVVSASMGTASMVTGPMVSRPTGAPPRGWETDGTMGTGVKSYSNTSYWHWPTRMPTNRPTVASNADSLTMSDHGRPVSTATAVPRLLSKCLNTWLDTTSCPNNTDFPCLCQNEEFIIMAMECLRARGTGGQGPISAPFLLVGMCASFGGHNSSYIVYDAISFTWANSYPNSLGDVMGPECTTGSSYPSTTTVYHTTSIFDEAFSCRSSDTSNSEYPTEIEVEAMYSEDEDIVTSYPYPQTRYSTGPFKFNGTSPATALILLSQTSPTSVYNSSNKASATSQPNMS